MATIKEVYELLKEKQKKGEKIGMLSKSLIEEYERQNDDNQSTKEVHVSFIKNKSSRGGSNDNS
jgi:hypothetical protein